MAAPIGAHFQLKMMRACPVLLQRFVRSYCKERPPPSASELLSGSATFEHMRPEAAPDAEFMTSPYPEGSGPPNFQAKHRVDRPGVDPKETSVLLFPGQGTQYVGMGASLLDIPRVKEMYGVASQILGYDLLGLCLNGPKEQLDSTEYCQPAVVVTSLAAVEKLRRDDPKAIENCVATAGFSVGELAALCFAGAISFPDVVKLVKVRAESMQHASDMAQSGMMVVHYGPESELNYAFTVARKWCQERGIEDAQCKVANYLYPHCKVIAGHVEALDFIQKNASDFHLRRLKRLPVSGAFHTSLMAPAVRPFREALSQIQLETPLIPVHSNVDGKRYQGAGHIQRLLPKQIRSPVQWEQTLHILYERCKGSDFPRTFECGPGSSLKTILDKVNRKACESYHVTEA